MEKLSQSTLNQAGQFIIKQGRPLERAIYEYHFSDGEAYAILKELKEYQNDDGGFGKAIESDFRLPYSSPMATSIGMRHLLQIAHLEEAEQQIRLAIRYLESIFNDKRNGWFAVSKEVNEFPHAPWWHYNEKDAMTIIDKNWGNPSAEIIAYLFRYQEELKVLDINNLVDFSIDYIKNKKLFKSENEVFCYIKLYEALPKKEQNRLSKRIGEAIEQVIIYNEDQWGTYVPKPLDFVDNPKKNRFNIDEVKIEKHLDFIVAQLEEYEKINPPWGESYYKGKMKPAYREWQGVLTLDALLLLKRYGRIENKQV